MASPPGAMGASPESRGGSSEQWAGGSSGAGGAAAMIGRVLGARYRLLALVGTGASAHVYLADDVKLRRRVAVKVLHVALADDEAFLRRFRAEAQSAAQLSHPNIVVVHDWN